jgi:hypothetical protein
MEHQAIYNTHTDVVSIRSEVPYDVNGNEVTIDQELVNAELATLQAEYDNAQYARDRAEAYPSLTDQADMQYWDSVNDTTTWQDAVAAVKAEFPKP